MIVCDEPGFVFAPNARAGSVSFTKALSERFPTARFVEPGHGLQPIDDGRERCTFTVVRNPFVRELSHYLFRRRNAGNNMHRFCRKWSFEEYMRWLIDPRIPPVKAKEPCQAGMIAGKPIDIVLKLERMPEDLERLPFLTEPLVLPHLHANPSYRLRDYYNETTLDLVQCYAAADFDRFNYKRYLLPED